MNREIGAFQAFFVVEGYHFSYAIFNLNLPT